MIRSLSLLAFISMGSLLMSGAAITFPKQGFLNKKNWPDATLRGGGRGNIKGESPSMRLAADNTITPISELKEAINTSEDTVPMTDAYTQQGSVQPAAEERSRRIVRSIINNILLQPARVFFWVTVSLPFWKFPSTLTNLWDEEWENVRVMWAPKRHRPPVNSWKLIRNPLLFIGLVMVGMLPTHFMLDRMNPHGGKLHCAARYLKMKRGWSMLHTSDDVLKAALKAKDDWVGDRDSLRCVIKGAEYLVEKDQMREFWGLFQPLLALNSAELAAFFYGISYVTSVFWKPRHLVPPCLKSYVKEKFEKFKPASGGSQDNNKYDRAYTAFVEGDERSPGSM